MPPSPPRSRRTAGASSKRVAGQPRLPHQPLIRDLLGIPAGRVKQLLRDRKLLAVTRPAGMAAVPAAFLDGHHIVKGLCGTLTLLFDCGFDELEALRWLFTVDDSLPGTPIDAIVQHRGTEVNRRAQALAF